MKNINIVLISIVIIFVKSIYVYSDCNNVMSRQIHLDFHTSELIPNIGKDFNRKKFQEALKLGHVNQINVFAKCHHSWSYYPTKVGKMHPNLKFDLLGEQIKACHEIGVKCPIYFTVGWSANDAKEHPEWINRGKNGEYTSKDIDFNANPEDSKPLNSWVVLCAAANGEYHKYILKNVEEICRNYDVDGFWFDIYHIRNTCYCTSCISRMRDEGIDINNEKEVERSYALSLKEHMRQLRELVGKYHPDATVFFNSATHISNKSIFTEKLYEMNTQQELEDLPTAWDGYDKLQYEAKYHLQKGYPIVAMSGKFHEDWGEFGGFKHADAIKYEAAAMISNGASCNFGDHLHPSGRMDLATYRNIGEAYKYVEKIEEYGPGGKPYSKLGVWLTLNTEADRGVVNMLLETHNDFVIADSTNLSDLSLLIVPGHNALSDNSAKQINDWVSKGGKLIVIGNGALNKAGDTFILDVGADFIKKSDYRIDYTIVGESLGYDVVDSPFLNYESANVVKPEKANVLAQIHEPYFDRTYGHYSGHRETPYKLEEASYPSIIRNGNVIYFCHNIDRLYFNHGVRIYRQIFENAINLLSPENVLQVKGLQSCGRVNLLEQEKQRRYVAHLLYSPALQRGNVLVIEDFVPVDGVKIELNVPEKIKKVYSIPSKEELRFKTNNGKVEVMVPEFSMHTGIVFEY